MGQEDSEQTYLTNQTHFIVDARSRFLKISVTSKNVRNLEIKIEQSR